MTPAWHPGSEEAGTITTQQPPARRRAEEHIAAFCSLRGPVSHTITMQPGTPLTTLSP
ncbi:MAG TPA: hypothetical protein VGF67_05565 [Ktedonobacteraceae bacterium]